MENLLEIKTAIRISKPSSEVFESIADPDKMKNYFISESSGKMEEGGEVIWKFSEFDIRFPVKVVKMVKHKSISFTWEIGKKDILVDINLSALEDNSTVVTITEKGMENNEEGIKLLKGNTEGWANFLACLKAYLEFGINLRKGGFDHLMKK
ncbi:MAG: SRPBCC domain-containing protein [Bacteroidetes bacterium]|nr:SRPBCC domain-containing protein [Bacteroidota bacterium]